eukprot:2481845-Amphidinium_carterae.1
MHAMHKHGTAYEGRHAQTPIFLSHVADERRNGQRVLKQYRTRLGWTSHTPSEGQNRTRGTTSEPCQIVPGSMVTCPVQCATNYALVVFMPSVTSKQFSRLIE